jgi:hypothetical protein
MHDEFLHRLRKEPRPEFAARLQAQLRRQARSPLGPRPQSRMRTIATLLLLGGGAFAFTLAVRGGFPTSWVELYQHTVTRMIAGHTSVPDHGQSNEGGVRSALGLDAGNRDVERGAAARNEFTHHAASTVSGPTTATAPSGGVTTSSSVGPGVPAGFQSTQVKVASSWSAYVYVLRIAEQINGAQAARGALRRFPASPIATGVHIDVSVRDSDQWPGPMCGHDVRAPNIAYAFAPFGTVSNQPCRPNSSGNARSVVAFPIGYEAVALARSPLYGELDLTRRQVFLALAKWIPDSRTGAVHANPNRTWRQVDAALGPEPIEFMGPPLASAAGRSMIELLMEAGCKTFPWVAALQSRDPDRFSRICRTVRTDGIYVELSSGNTRERVLAEPNAVGIFGLNREEAFQLRDLVAGRVDGQAPTLQSIDSGAYPGSRALYLYIRPGNVAPNVLFNLLRDELFTSFGDSAFVAPTEAQFRAANLAMFSPGL